MLPTLYILPLFFDLDGVWASLPTVNRLSASITYATLYWYHRSIKSRHYPKH
ncbi:hypothetical protein [Gilliamella sp. W8128]|uniref:hypothetical protein n=1 Tax=Gilliamella sp. W8128 TaxID=2751010 RepID=UPI001E46676A|nr:hypothetical protein [Gilliamella sp. W8128]MBI0155066.1 hypothetical protein [Gilliamella sp. W8128]